MKKKLLALLLVLVMVVAAIPVSATGAFFDVRITPSKTNVAVGDTVEYTITATGEDIACKEFTLVIPEGMTYVPGSASIPAGLKDTLGWEAVDWTESSMKWTGYCDKGADFAADTVLLTFSCTVDAEGSYEIGLHKLVTADSDFVPVTPVVNVDTVVAEDSAKTASMDVKISADKAKVAMGETINYTITATGSDIVSMEFKLVIPQGLEFKSGSVPATLKDTLKWAAVDWTESSMKWTGYNDKGVDFAEGTVIMTFSCTAKATGNYEVGITNLLPFSGSFQAVTPTLTVAEVAVEGCNHVFTNGVCGICGTVEAGYTGLVDRDGQKYYYVNGVQSTATGLTKIDGVWYYLKSGRWASELNQLAKYNGEWWYLVDGKVASSTTALIDLNGEDWYVVKGKIAANTTGLIKVDGIWYYVVKGKVAGNTTNLIKYNGEWFYVVKGKVASTTTAMIKFNGEDWYVVKGKIAANTTGLVKYDGVWYYVVKGKLAGNTTSLVKYNNEWFYVINGRVDSKTTGIVVYNGGWYYLVKGKIAAKTTTLVKHGGAWYYVEAGSVNWKFSGTFKFAGKNYTIKNGRVV